MPIHHVILVHNQLVQATSLRCYELDCLYGSVRSRHQAPALAAFVHQGKSLARLTLAQLAGNFGADRRRGLPPILHWSDLGVERVRGSHPMQLYGFGTNSSEAHFFEKAIFNGGLKWNCELHEFYDDSDGGEPVGAKSCHNRRWSRYLRRARREWSRGRAITNA